MSLSEEMCGLRDDNMDTEMKLQALQGKVHLLDKDVQEIKVLLKQAINLMGDIIESNKNETDSTRHVQGDINEEQEGETRQD